MKIAIVDDAESDRLVLHNLLSDFFQFTGMEITLFEYDSAENFLSSLQINTYNLAFLDIFMSNMNGMEAAHQLINLDSNCTIIFLTTSLEFALEGYEVGAFRYLLKPLSSDKLKETLTPFLKKFKNDTRTLMLMVNRTPVYIPYPKIYYVSSVLRTTEVHLQNKVLSQSSGINFMKTVEPLMSDSRFYSPSKGFIVNMDYVSKITKEHFILENHEVVPISRRIMPEAKKEFLNYNINKNQ